MIAFSNKKFLTLFVAMVVACSLVAVANAESLRIRRRDRQRKLKMKNSKGGSSKGGGSKGSVSATNFSFRPNNIINNAINSIKPIFVSNPVDTNEFGDRCPNQENELNSCLEQNGKILELCHFCIKGQANINALTAYGLKSCSNSKFNGGYCGGCYQQVLDFYNCGSGKTLGGATSSTPATGTPPVVVSGSTPITGGTGGGLTTIQTGNTPGMAGIPGGSTATVNTVNTMENYAPATNCPFDAQVSGDECSVPGGYKFLECYFTNLKCTCRFNQPVWMCV